MSAAEREELKAAASVLRVIKDILTTEQEAEIIKRLEAVENALNQSN